MWSGRFVQRLESGLIVAPLRYNPRNLRPMLAETDREAFDDPAWIYEVKWDGFRLLAFVQDGRVELLSRNLHLFTALFRPIADSLRSFPAHLIFDGEAVMLDKRGRPGLRGPPNTTARKLS